MELGRALRFSFEGNEYCFRTLLPGDVSQSYVESLRKESGVLENHSAEMDIGWQQDYTKGILVSPSDTICGLFMDSELIGTSGIQNLSASGAPTRPMRMTQGYTHDCTIGIFVLNGLRGRGYGKVLVWSSSHLANVCFQREILRACILKRNLASVKSFLACGFEAKEDGISSLDVELEASRLIKPSGMGRAIIE